jgi:hypothetical protein
VFLARVFQKLLVNFTWWVNRKDVSGRHIFSGGFLGLDNIGVFDRSKPLPGGGQLEQADGTAWMAFYCSTMLAMASSWPRAIPAYEDIASKFFEHFVAIADAMNTLGGTGCGTRRTASTTTSSDRRRVGPAAAPLDRRHHPALRGRVHRGGAARQAAGLRQAHALVPENRKDLAAHISYMARDGQDAGRRMLAIPTRERLERVLRYVFDEGVPVAVRRPLALARYRDHPFHGPRTGGETYRVDYEPGESRTWLFGGNSNWRGPVWFPLNYLLIEALQRYHHFYGDSFTMEFPDRQRERMNLEQIARELARRLVSLFMLATPGRAWAPATRRVGRPWSRG